MKETITTDLTRNPKQGTFFNTVMESAFGDNPYRYLFYGGGIRGGKTYACLACLVILCKIFPKSKWYVIRNTFPSLQETTIPTIEKMLGPGALVKWSHDKSNYFVEFLKTGSRIYFAGENFERDTEQKWMLGLECNGFFIEQIEQIEELTFDMAISRAGSWIIPNMPTPLILASFNATMTWVRQKVYDPFKEDKLNPPYFFQPAESEDNPYNTEEQWKNWENLPDDLYGQFIKNNWEFKRPSNVFAYSFDEKKHHKDVVYNSDYFLYATFDFNVEPIVCLLSQHDLGWIHHIKEIRLLNSDVWALTDHIISNFPDSYFMVTGDATGRARSAISRGNKTYYQIIRDQLQVSTNQIVVPRANPSIRNTRVLMNALFAKHPNHYINTKACPHFTLDLNSVVVKGNGEIDKDADKRKSHLLDCFIGETLIETNTGQRQIKEIRVGDKVLTRAGYNSVVDHWQSEREVFEYEFSDGSKINCTKDHKFHTYFGWMPIDTVYLNKIQLCQRRSFIKDRVIPNMEDITEQQLTRKRLGFIGKFGRIISGQFQKVTTFITKTRTQTTTNRKTLNCLQGLNIVKCTCVNESKKILRSLKDWLKLGGHLQKPGMDLRLALSGINNMRPTLGLEKLPTDKPIVLIVESHLKRKLLLPNFATIIVSQATDENCFVTVLSRKCIGKRKVYDITVEGMPEFYANGFLVHNCGRYYNWTWHRDFIDKNLYQYLSND